MKKVISRSSFLLITKITTMLLFVNSIFVVFSSFLLFLLFFIVILLSLFISFLPFIHYHFINISVKKNITQKLEMDPGSTFIGFDADEVLSSPTPLKKLGSVQELNDLIDTYDMTIISFYFPRSTACRTSNLAVETVAKVYFLFFFSPFFLEKQILLSLSLLLFTVY